MKQSSAVYFRTVVRCLLVVCVVGIAQPLRALVRAPTAPSSSLGACQAQTQRSGPQVRIDGRIVDADDDRPVTAGSVTLRRPRDSSFAGGALLRDDGTFRVEGVVPGEYVLRIRALGYAPIVRTNIVVGENASSLDLGLFRLVRLPHELSTTVIEAERDPTRLAIDRNTYAVKDMTGAAGGTAIDVLRHVPGVDVDGDNKVSLRGNTNVVVQINGRPSPLQGNQLGAFLAQLPASAIRHVEVATNPSAKSDPDGTAGIINVVLPDAASLESSSAVSVGAGTTGLVSISGNMARRRGAWTVFGSYGLSRDDRSVTGTSDRLYGDHDTPRFLTSNTSGSFAPLGHTMTVRSEWRATSHDIIGTDLVVAPGTIGREVLSVYEARDSVRSVLNAYAQSSAQRTHNFLGDYVLNHQHQFGAEEHRLVSELRYTDARYSYENDVTGQTIAEPGQLAELRSAEASDNRLPSWNVKVDYTRPIGSGGRLEAGVQGIDRHNMSDYHGAFAELSGTGADSITSAVNAFGYRERLNSAYTVVSESRGRATVQAGVRVEREQLALDSRSTSGTYERRSVTAYPSAAVSLKPDALREVKLSYSRRVARPQPYQLNPFPFRQDATMLFHGREDLRPEATDAIELTLQQGLSFGSLQLTPFYRRTRHAIRDVTTVDDDGITTTVFTNLLSLASRGVEGSLSVRRPGWSFVGGGGAYRVRADADETGSVAAYQVTGWSVRGNGTVKLSASVDAQAFASYRSAMTVPGGRESPFTILNLSLRSRLPSDRGSVTLRVSDPFSMMSFGLLTTNGRIVQFSNRRPGMRGVYLSFNYLVGKQVKLRPTTEPDAGSMLPPTGG